MTTIKTVDLPAAWFRSAYSFSPNSGTSSYMRFGWEWSDYYQAWFRHSGWVKFDTSQIATLDPNKILGGEIKITLGYIPSHSSYEFRLYQVLKNAVSNQITWNAYSTGLSWATPGGLYLGSDIDIQWYTTHEFDSLENSISLTAANISAIHSANKPILFTQPTQPPGSSYATISSLSNIFLRVSYEASSLAGDVTIF